jgi:hypothetical protein
MPKYLSSEPCTHLFDELPTDMIYYEIFPFLDYNSRVTANLLLPKEDRLRTPLQKDAVAMLEMSLGKAAMGSLIKKQSRATNPISRNRLTLKIWRTVTLFPSLYQYNSKFREVVAAKAVEFSDPSMANYTHVSNYTRKELKKLCTNFLLSLETSHPYICELTTL